MYRHSFVLHSVIQTNVEGTRTYYEVVRKVYNGYELGFINPKTGETTHGFRAVDGTLLIGLGLVAPSHPVYIKWAQRRLQDRLEGLDRS